MIVVSDTSPFLSLAYLNQLHLLPLLFKTVVIPFSVKNELLNSRLSVEQKEHFLSPQWLSAQKPSDDESVKLLVSKKLHLPEAEAIILAKEIHADYILIDENMGRIIAKEKGLVIVGVLGILLRAKQQNLITELKPLLDKLMTGQGFWISKKLYEQLLQLSHEL